MNDPEGLSPSRSPCQLLGTCHQVHNKDLPVRAPGWLQALDPSCFSPLLPRASDPLSSPPLPSPLSVASRHKGTAALGESSEAPGAEATPVWVRDNKEQPQGWADPAPSPLELPWSPQALNPLQTNADKSPRRV